jgi:hypothetical protein
VKRGDAQHIPNEVMRPCQLTFLAYVSGYVMKPALAVCFWTKSAFEEQRFLAQANLLKCVQT